MSARDAVLGAVRAALDAGRTGRSPGGTGTKGAGTGGEDGASIARGKGDAARAARIADEARALLADPDAIRPALMAPDVVEAFVARAAGPKLIGTSVERIARPDEFPQAVARYLAAQGLPASIVLQPAEALRALDWTGFAVRDAIAPDEACTVGVARWAIAETGSVVFHSGADTPILFNFLPLHHVVLVRADSIVGHLEDYVAAFEATGEPAPRNVNLVTGASGTTDIEGILVRGAHGPRSLHLVVAG